MASVQLGFDFFDEGQKSAELTGNDALFALDAHVHLSVKDVTNTPPGSPANGDRYLAASSPTGAWTGWANRVVAWRASEWVSFTPKEGQRLWVEDDDAEYHYDGSAWVTMVPGSVQTGITAHAGGGQASAVALTAEICIVTVVATAGDSVKLLPATKGLSQFVKNADSTDSMNVFPSSADAIDGAAADTAVAIAAGKARLFKAVDTTNWYSLLGA